MKKIWKDAKLISLDIAETAAGPVPNATIDGAEWDEENCWWDTTTGEGGDDMS